MGLHNLATYFITSPTNGHSVLVIIGFSDLSLQIIGMKSGMLLRPSNIDKTKNSMTNGSLMEVEINAECPL